MSECRYCGCQTANTWRVCPRCAGKHSKRPRTGWALALFALFILITAMRLYRGYRNSEPTRAKPVVSTVERVRLAPKLIKEARAAEHPGIILRNACQVPEESPLFKEASRQIARAEHILESVIMRPARKMLAQKLQE